MAVSLLLLQGVPVFAQNIPADDDVSIKTLAPLENNAGPAPAETTPSPSSTPRPASSTVRDTLPPAMPSPASATTESGGTAKGASSNLSFTPGDPSAPATDSGTAKPAATNAQPAVVETGKVPQSAQPSGMQFSADAPDGQSSKDGQQLAQRSRNTDQSSLPTAGAAKRPGVLSVVGTVQIRKPFKVFVTEQLIHNMSFRDTPVKEVIAEIARRGNLNILIDPSVTGRITGELRDVTLNEAMDSILAAAGLQHRTLDNNTVVVATLQSIVQLGLNRPMARVFKLSYAHPYDVAMLLHASVFNRGMIPDYSNTSQRTNINDVASENSSERSVQGGGAEPEGEAKTMVRIATKEAPTQNQSERETEINRPDQSRTVRGSSQSRTQEGVGFNNAATDPGSQQIRSYQEINTDYIVEQNGGGAIVIPDAKNQQVLVVGTVEDLQVAEEAIRMIDRRPRQVHIQASLIELNNQAVRELGANLNLQGYGLSSSLLGNATAPLVQFLPGLGSQLQTGSPGNTSAPNSWSGGAPPLVPFSTNTTPNGVAGAFTGLVGTLLPAVPQAIAGVQPTSSSQSGFNFLTLGNGAGGQSNIATIPTALNISLNLLLQTNKAKIVANPSVIVVDDTETLITIASEVIHKVTSTVSLGVVTTNVELTKAGVFLNVLPRITEDGFIVMRLRPQVSAPTGAPITFGSTTAPTTVTLLSVREIMSQEVRVKDGQTLVLGGLFTEQEASQLSKVPYLAEAPILGAFFRNSLKGRDRTELMLLLTPKVVEDDPAAISETAAPTM